MLRAQTWLLFVCACASGVPFDEPGYQAPADAGSRADSAGEDPGGPTTPPRETAPPSVSIVSPTAGTPPPAFRIDGTSADDSAVASVFVSVAGNTPRLAQTMDGFRTWWIDATAPAGPFTVQATAYDLFGNTGSDAVSLGSGAGDTSAPTVTVSDPGAPAQLTVLLRGTAVDNVAVTSMRVRLDGVLLAGQVIASDDFFATWSTLIALTPGKLNTLRFEACDAAGNCGVATLQLQGKAEVDDAPPTVAISVPLDGATVSTASLAVSGTARDNLGVREVKVRVPSGDYVVATRTPQPDGSVAWSALLPIGPGAVTVQARAIDVSGLATTAEIAVTNNYAAPYSDELVIPLRVYTVTTPPQLRASLDKAGVNAIIDAATQKDTLLLAVNPTTLLTNALTSIRDACNWETSSASCTAGTAKVPDWAKNLRTPDYNCNCTALGQSFAGGEVSPEFRLVRVLTMTPANVEVAGTSVAKLAQLANDWGLGGGFNQIVADMLGISLTSTVVRISDVVTPLRDRFMASHPYLNPAQNTFVTSGKWTAFTAGHVPVTLYDAMNDLAPLGTALGPNSPGMPASAHPGVLDPSLAPFSKVLLDSFRMLLVADSNLRWFDGVELDTGKDYLARIVDSNGGNDVLEFDFNDPAKFDLIGIAASPVVDLRLKIFEKAGKVPACTSNDGTCKANTPSQPYGTAYVWSRPRWELENIVTAAVLGRYLTRTFYKCYLSVIVCVADITISNPAVNRDGITGGWTDAWTAFGYGDPPDDQYLWELISEIVQVALHRVGNTLGAIPEGSANPAFTLDDIPLGLTAAQIKAAIRPTLQAQKAALSQALLGDFKQNNGAVDFTLVKGAEGALYLFFTDPSDPTPTPYANPKPGFFASEALTGKLSTKAAGTSGDAIHEKLKLAVGDVTVYAQDPLGNVYRLRVHVPPAGDVEVRLARKL